MLTAMRREFFAPEAHAMTAVISTRFTKEDKKWEGDFAKFLPEGFKLVAAPEAFVPHSPCAYGECESQCCFWASFKVRLDMSTYDRGRIEQHMDGIKKETDPRAGIEAINNFTRKKGRPLPDILPMTHVCKSATLHNDREGCVMLSRDSDGKLGCSIHRYALKQGVPFYSLKPESCVLFPAWVRAAPDKTYIVDRATPWRDDWPKCANVGTGMPLLAYKVEDLTWYYGQDAVANLMIEQVDDLCGARDLEETIKRLWEIIDPPVRV